MSNEVFELNGMFYEIPQDKYETREVFLERVWYILKILKAKPDKKIEKLIRLSRLYSNVKRLGCKYNQNLMDESN